MKTLFGIGVAAAAIMAANPAQAATFNITLQGGTGIFGNIINAPGTFSDFVNFVSPAGFANSSVVSISLPNQSIIQFTSIMLDTNAYTMTSPGGPGSAQVWELLNPVALSAGNHTISLTGTSNASATNAASYGGVVNVNSAVPEPSTWIMMIGGFALVGLAMRRRTRLAVSYN